MLCQSQIRILITVWSLYKIIRKFTAQTNYSREGAHFKNVHSKQNTLRVTQRFGTDDKNVSCFIKN